MSIERNDPWSASIKGNKLISNKFDDNFITVDKKDHTIQNLLSGEEYSKKLEKKLCELQNQKYGKEMRQFCKNRKNLYMDELLNKAEDIHDETASLSNPTFLDTLYSTNKFYRHLNPQQALDAVEKGHLPKYDHLDIRYQSELNDNEDIA